jgi:hypothetical protein
MSEEDADAHNRRAGETPALPGSARRTSFHTPT